MKQRDSNSAWGRYCLTAILAVSTVAVTAAEAAAESNTRVYLGNWAGYVVKGDFHQVSATWVQPEITCLNPGTMQRVVPWVGLNGATDREGKVALPLMQTGVESMCASDAAAYAGLPGLQLENLAAGLAYADPRLAGVVMNAGDNLSNAVSGAADQVCASGALGEFCRPDQYVDAWWEVYPEAPFTYDDVDTRPGDTMRSSVEWDGHAYTMTLENRTRGWTRSTVRPSDAPAKTAEIVIEGHLDAALPGFTPVTFTEVEIDGKPLSAYDAQTYGIRATNRVLAPGPVEGAGFTLA